MIDKRILVQIDTPIYERDLPGGAEKVIHDLIEALSSGSWQVHVLCPVGDELHPGGGNPRYHLVRNRVGGVVGQVLNSVRGVRRCKDIIEDYDFDIVLDNVSHVPYYPLHYFSPSNNVVFLHSLQLKDARRFKPLHQALGIEFIERTLPYLHRPHVVCTSRCTERRLHDQLGYRRTSVLNPAIDLERYEYNFAPDSDFVLSLGRLGPRKDVQCLLRAWDRIQTQNLELVICGSGPEEGKLRRLVDDLDLSSVRFEGRVSEPRKLELFSEARLFVFPTHHEGFGITGLEAMASGTPVIGADTWGLREYIDHGTTGLLYERSDPDDLADKLAYAINDTQHLAKIAEQGRNVANRHSRQHFEGEARDLLEELLTKSNPHQPAGR